jgi:hypothetical protein
MMGAQVAWTSTVDARWRCMQRRSEAHGVNLDGGHTGGVDLNSGRAVEAHTEEE